MQTVSRPERSGCDTFWTTDKKQFNLDYQQLYDFMKFLWLNSKLHNKLRVKKSIFWLRMKLQSVQLSILTNSLKPFHSSAKLVQCHGCKYISLGATMMIQLWYTVSTYLQILQIHSDIQQCHVRNKNYFNSFVNTKKKSIINENNH